MRRLGPVIAIAAVGVGIAGCSSPSWLPSWDFGFPSSPPPATTIQLESEPGRTVFHVWLPLDGAARGSQLVR